MSFLIMIILTNSLMLMFLKHPLSMGLILLIQTIMTSIITGLMNYNFWFSYILFLIMIGGMLILFIYMTSIASNEKFKFSMILTIMFFTNMTLDMILQLLDQYYFSLFMSTHDLTPQSNIINNYFSMTKYFNYPNNIILYLMIIYLLVTLIMVVKITNIKKGPMRPMY